MRGRNILRSKGFKNSEKERERSLQGTGSTSVLEDRGALGRVLKDELHLGRQRRVKGALANRLCHPFAVRLLTNLLTSLVLHVYLCKMEGWTGCSKIL